MTTLRKGLCWAAAFLLTFTARQLGIFETQAADTILLVLPIVAVMSLRNQNSCVRLSAKQR